MQKHSLLATKLYIPPIRPELVSRPRLIEQLNAGLQRRLTLVSAPAGFGKTTLVSEWVSQFRVPILASGVDSPEEDSIQIPQPEIENRVAWLSLDEGDNDPARFLAYMIAALRTLVLSGAEGTTANLGKGALSLVHKGLESNPPACTVRGRAAAAHHRQ